MASVMKKLFFLFVITGMIVFLGCYKNLPDTTACTNKSPDEDSSALLKYASDSAIHVTRDSTGLYFQILDTGNNNRPNLYSNIRVNYVGRLMNGAIFDSASNSSLNGLAIYKLIPGWKFGLPKIGVGGHIILLVPSDYAYGCTGYPPIVPENAPVYFDVKLLQVE
jgi:FKBP-type peptidyl-prolyl cis-trans isomerase FkpA